MTISQMYSGQHTLFGRGSLQKLLPMLAETPQPTLLFCGRSFLNSEAYAAIKAELNEQIIGYEIVGHEASPADVDGWVQRWRGHVDRVVAIGGGSVLDAAKAFAAMSQQPENTLRYLEKVGDLAVIAATLPLIAIPTTAGTGSEVTQNAVITDQGERPVKASLRHPVFVPAVAILDADLLRGTPATILAHCGIDAFTHLFEAYLSGKGNHFTRQLALTGLQNFMRGWPDLLRDDAQGDEAREAMMLASWLGGVSLSTAGLGVIHGLAGEIGAIKPWHHGEVCGRLLLPFLNLLDSAPNAQQQQWLTEMQRVLFPGTAGSPAAQLSEWLQRTAITPFWQQPPALTPAEIDWVLTRANNKNGVVDYDKTQQRMLLSGAFHCG